MASVYYLYQKSYSLDAYLENQHRNLILPGRKLHYAALIIQRVWRGYRVRKMIKYWHRMATVIQRWVRGWLVRWHLPEILEELARLLILKWYNRMATIIQAWWRGCMVRRKMAMPLKDLVRNKKLMDKANDDVVAKMRALFAQSKAGSATELSEEKRIKIGDECRRWVLYILFKTHHLVRTYVQEGIYSNHGSTKKSQIEEWMSKLPMKKYMDDLRKIYYNDCINKKRPICYIFKDPKYRKLEEAYRQYDNVHEPKPLPNSVEFVPDIHKKPFDLIKRPIRYPYTPTMARETRYGIRGSILRRYDKLSRDSDFDLDVHHLAKVEERPPPYYIDAWSKKCPLHYPYDD